MSKALCGGISAVVMVAATIGIIAVVYQSNRSSPPHHSRNPISKLIDAFCSPTDYKDVCESSLTSTAHNDSSHQDLAAAAFNATFDSIKLAVNLTFHLKDKAVDERNQMAMEDCRQLLEFAIDDFNVIMSKVNNASDLAQMSHDIKTWLSADITYTDTCLDGITQADIHADMAEGLANASRLCSNAIAIINELQPLLSAVAVQQQSDSANRRLFERRKLLAAAAADAVTPDAVVAQDGSGNFTTIGDALKAVPPNNTEQFVIYVKAGVYKEYVNVTKDMKHVFMYGDGPEKTVVTGGRNTVDGLTTVNTATFNVIADFFMVKGMGFINSAGPEKHQAVALRMQSDYSIIHNCRMDGYQDTLYAHAKTQFYSNCTITGTIDYIFGSASAVFQNCSLIVRRPMDNQRNAVTAHGRQDKQQVSGFVFQGCVISAEGRLHPDRLTIPTFLGRPWRPFARTVFMESEIGDVIQPEGWLAWEAGTTPDACYYGEYANTGAGAATQGRVKWPCVHLLSREQAADFTADAFLLANEWLPAANVSYHPDL